MKRSYIHTVRACFIGYIVQAITLNFAPLLFVTFQNSYNISLTKITTLVTINFFIQLTMDASAAPIADRVGYRPLAVISNCLCAVGMILLSILPNLFSDPYVGLLIATITYAAGSGMLEVISSPMVEACPLDNKDKTMSLLHSFYNWGQMAVVLISTLCFAAFGISNWHWIAIAWAVVPAVNAVNFLTVPIAPLLKADEKGMTLYDLLHTPVFYLFLLAMFCSGAAEHSMAAWTSALVETTLGVNKTIGDIAGITFFALMMGIARMIYGRKGEKISLKCYMLICAMLCIVAYLMIALSPWPALVLVGCGLSGFAVGIFWPGTLSMSSAILRRGGNMMFCLLALAGDLGSSLGPTLVGFVSGASDDNLKIGIFAAIVFPLALVIVVRSIAKRVRN